jgi:ELWxxDGT repeat protein
MTATTSTHLQFCRRLATFIVLAVLPAIPAFAQPVRVMPVTPTAFPVAAFAPTHFAATSGHLYFNVHDLSGDVTGANVLWKSDGTAAGTMMVRNIDAPFSTDGYAAVGDRLYFRGTLPNTLPGLVVTDGTFAGTRRLGEGGSNATEVNGTIFSVDPATNRLFKSDGTEAGTVPLKQHAAVPRDLRNVGGNLLYMSGTELWKSDGTVAGTVLVKAFLGDSWVPASPRVAVHGNKLFLRGTDSAGTELWVSDGTTAGTIMLKDIAPGPDSSLPTSMASAGGALYFTTGGDWGQDVWKTDGTPAGTVQVTTFDPYVGPGPRGFTATGSTVVFNADSGIDIWKTDGTAAGTVRVKDLPPSGRTLGFWNVSGGVCYLVETGNYTLNLWRTDGTEAGTIELMQDIAEAGAVASTGSRVFVKRRSAASAFEIWSSDCASPGGNVFVKDLGQGLSNDANDFKSLTWMGSHLMLNARTTVEGSEPWRADGTSGTLVKDVEPGAASGFPESVDGITRKLKVRSGNTLFFTGATSAAGSELWRSDGTPGGTVLVKDIAPGATGSGPSSLTEVGGTIYFLANDGVHGVELWKSDGTEAGTVLVKDIHPGIDSGLPFFGTDLVSVNGVVYFRANDGVNGPELWKSDGTAAGTVVVKDIVPGAIGSSPTVLAAAGGTLMFSATTPDIGTELWKTDGTAAGTVLVKDIAPGFDSGMSYPDVPPGGIYPYPVVMNGVMYFTTRSGSLNFPLWRTDGTSAGTWQLSPNANNLLVLGNSLYFSSAGLWKSDGTVAGTVLLRGFAGGLTLQNGYGFAELNGILYFAASESPDPLPLRRELWRTDGTPAGTYQVTDLFPGGLGSNPTEITAAGDRIYFLANDGVNPRSLYSYVPLPPAAETTRLANLSSRMQVLLGNNVMIGGFVIGGSTTKCVAIVATGPSLAQHGIAGPMQDPRLTLVRASDQAVIATNDNWQTAPASPCLGAEAFVATDPREARVVAELPPGAYTAIVQGANDADTGVAVLGIYEVDKPGVPLVNISARGPVFGGEQQMIGGFVIQGPNPQTVAVVATGPSLAAHGIPNALQNPVLTLVRQSDGAVVATNDNWVDAPNAALIDGAGFAPPNVFESAILVTLPPGAYTAIVSGAGGGSGIGVVGVYRVN